MNNRYRIVAPSKDTYIVEVQIPTWLNLREIWKRVDSLDAFSSVEKASTAVQKYAETRHPRIVKYLIQ